MVQGQQKKTGFLQRVIDKCTAIYRYCTSGVWKDNRRKPLVRLIKITNLSVNSFLDRGLQIKSMALTYSTVLALVPALALIVAIGRGFGLQDSIQNELYILFPSQHRIIGTILNFVDSYLTNATQGIFVGVGIIVLLWTVVMLLSGIEDAVNNIWGVKKMRTIFRKFTDYITICLMVPILLICSSGISIFMSDSFQDILYLSFLTPVVNFVLDLAPLFLAWIAFSISYWLIPNTKVNFKFAAIAGAFCSIAFYVIQWLFINGQIYVSKYNAIYGSFAFLPLFLIWLQLSWLIMLIGNVLTYSMQNVFTFNLLGTEQNQSVQTRARIFIIVMAVVAQRFLKRQEPLTPAQMASQYNLPVHLLSNTLQQLREGGMIYTVTNCNGDKAIGPAQEVKDMTVETVLKSFYTTGSDHLSDELSEVYASLFDMLQESVDKCLSSFRKYKLADLPIPLPEQIEQIIYGTPDAHSGNSSTQVNP